VHTYQCLQAVEVSSENGYVLNKTSKNAKNTPLLHALSVYMLGYIAEINEDLKLAENLYIYVIQLDYNQNPMQFVQLMNTIKETLKYTIEYMNKKKEEINSNDGIDKNRIKTEKVQLLNTQKKKKRNKKLRKNNFGRNFVERYVYICTFVYITYFMYIYMHVFYAYLSMYICIHIHTYKYFYYIYTNIF
jgi:hypothetical protein